MNRRIVFLVVCLTSWFSFGMVSVPAAEAAPRSGPAAEQDCGGSAPIKPDGSRWECTFSDEFDGDSLDRSKWTPHTQHGSGSAEARACNVDDPRNVAVADGALRLTVRKAKTPVVCERKPADYTAGNVSTYDKFSQQYARFEARIKPADAADPGLQEAFWLWPDVRETRFVLWPLSGEIDIAETYSHQPKLAIPFLHYAGINALGPRPGVNTAWDCEAERGAYNTYTLTWTRDSLTIDVNGKTCLVNRSGNRAFNKPFIAALTSALGKGRNALTPETPMPATMSVDYFRVWR
jgi:beta-glucanase (GH16 family)